MVNRGEEEVKVHMNVVPRSTGSPVTRVNEERNDRNVKMTKAMIISRDPEGKKVDIKVE